jgi:hypothetical protein
MGKLILLLMTHAFTFAQGTPARELRILLLHDRFTGGGHIPEANTISARIEDYLHQFGGRPVRVLAAPVDPSSTAESLRRLPGLMASFQPDYLIFAVLNSRSILVMESQEPEPDVKGGYLQKLLGFNEEQYGRWRKFLSAQLHEIAFSRGLIGSAERADATLSGLLGALNEMQKLGQAAGVKVVLFWPDLALQESDWTANFYQGFAFHMVRKLDYFKYRLRIPKQDFKTVLSHAEITVIPNSRIPVILNNFNESGEERFSETKRINLVDQVAKAMAVSVIEHVL